MDADKYFHISLAAPLYNIMQYLNQIIHFEGLLSPEVNILLFFVMMFVAGRYAIKIDQEITPEAIKARDEQQFFKWCKGLVVSAHFEVLKDMVGRDNPEVRKIFDYISSIGK